MPTEKELAKRVVSSLKQRGWKVYQEVLCPRRKRVVDIYAVRQVGTYTETCAVEVKRSFGLQVMEQACYWQDYANEAFIAAPRLKSRRARAFALKICRFLGLGVYEITPRTVRHALHAKRASSHKTVPLVEAQRHSEAGSADRDHWTPFKGTCDNLAQYVKHNSGVGLLEAIRAIEHHYKSERSAFSSLKKHLIKGRVDGIKIRFKRGQPFLFKS